MKDNIREIVANNLITLRKQKGLTQNELAKKLSYSDNMVSRWERAEISPSIETLEKISEFYEIFSPNVRSVFSFGAANVTVGIASIGVGVLTGLSCLAAYVAKIVAFTGVDVLTVSLSLKLASVTYVIALA